MYKFIIEYKIFAKNKKVRKLKYESLRTFVPFINGDKGARTPDLLHAMQALSQLSYTPKKVPITDYIIEKIIFNRLQKLFLTIIKSTKQFCFVLFNAVSSIEIHIPKLAQLVQPFQP